MKWIGLVACEGEGGDVFEEETGEVVYVHSPMEEDEDEKPSEPRRFHSLEALIAWLPKGVDYFPGGKYVHDPEKHREWMERTSKVSKELEEYYASRGPDWDVFNIPDVPPKKDSE